MQYLCHFWVWFCWLLCFLRVFFPCFWHTVSFLLKARHVILGNKNWISRALRIAVNLAGSRAALWLITCSCRCQRLHFLNVLSFLLLSSGCSAITYCYYIGACWCGVVVNVCKWEQCVVFQLSLQSFDRLLSQDCDLHSCFFRCSLCPSSLPTTVYSLPLLQCSELCWFYFSPTPLDEIKRL